MKNVTITGEGCFGYYKYERQTGRGIILRGDEILMSYESKADRWEIPGGGREDGESFEECCKREVQEETGYIVNVGKPVVTLAEYYDEARMIHKIFLCEITGEGEMNPTEGEINIGARPEWIRLDRLMPILEKSAAGDEDPDNYRIHLRGNTVLKAYLDEINNGGNSNE